MPIEWVSPEVFDRCRSISASRLKFGTNPQTLPQPCGEPLDSQPQPLCNIHHAEITKRSRPVASTTGRRVLISNCCVTNRATCWFRWLAEPHAGRSRCRACRVGSRGPCRRGRARGSHEQRRTVRHCRRCRAVASRSPKCRAGVWSAGRRLRQGNAPSQLEPPALANRPSRS